MIKAKTLLLIWIFFSCVFTANAHEPRRVDLNTYDGSDLNKVVNHILGKTPFSSSLTLKYDMDENGSIDGQDLNILINIILGKRIDTREMKHTGIFNIGGVEFKMIKVNGGSMDMGLRGNHTVGDFWIMETEMTIGLVNAIYELSQTLKENPFPDPLLRYRYYDYLTEQYYPPSYDFGADFVSYKKDWACNFCDPFTIKSYISFLASYTDCDFRLPTVEEWIFAAKGGNLSRGYKYSGSDEIDEVAWYQGNLPNTDNLVWGLGLPQYFPHEIKELYPKDVIPNKVHCRNVKQKAPNELGIYDMSGNAAEISVIDKSPYSYDNGMYLMQGGSVLSDETECIPGEAYQPEQCTLIYRHELLDGPYYQATPDEEVDLGYKVTITGLQQYLAVGLRLVMTADPVPEASPVVTVEPNVIKSNTVAATDVNESIDTQSLNTKKIQP